MKNSWGCRVESGYHDIIPISPSTFWSVLSWLSESVLIVVCDQFYGCNVTFFCDMGYLTKIAGIDLVRDTPPWYSALKVLPDTNKLIIIKLYSKWIKDKRLRAGVLTNNAIYYILYYQHYIWIFFFFFFEAFNLSALFWNAVSWKRSCKRRECNGRPSSECFYIENNRKVVQWNGKTCSVWTALKTL